ncbi:hypothetical protein [Tahibacter sp.]|uniref:hypothetical protein n=1 Tax=Tahibacter sp. TaxID=2056211 RepID=UPI0028C3B443|nr:hypothetical protein [Tahibacter sp.]
MHQALRAIGGVVLLLVVGSVSAAVQCVNCSDTQMYSKARTLGASPTAHIVWNPANGAIKKYRNYCGSAPNVGGGNGAKSEAPKAGNETNAGCTLQTEEVAITSDLVDMAGQMSLVWRGTNGTFKSSVTADVGSTSFPTYLPGKPTAHDFLLDGSLRNQLLDLASTQQIFQMNPNSSLAGPLSYIAGHLDAYFAMTQGIVITIDIVFDDGSKVQVRATLGENAVYVKDSARDDSGHWLPDRSSNPQDYTGRWYFPPGQGPDMAAFIEYMRSLGIPISSGAANGGVITCSWNPTNNTTTCVIPN